MILFNTTIIVSNSIEREWLDWMKNRQIPAIMATGLPVENRILRLVTDVDQEGTTYTCQYLFDSMEKYDLYLSDYQSFFDGEHHDRYRDQYFSFQTILEEV
jgi:hypothetical protein